MPLLQRMLLLHRSEDPLHKMEDHLIAADRPTTKVHLREARTRTVTWVDRAMGLRRVHRNSSNHQPRNLLTILLRMHSSPTRQRLLNTISNTPTRNHRKYKHSSLHRLPSQHRIRLPPHLSHKYSHHLPLLRHSNNNFNSSRLGLLRLLHNQSPKRGSKHRQRIRRVLAGVLD
jgi:hypothetical protein